MDSLKFNWANMKELIFSRTPLLSNPHIQTILGSFNQPKQPLHSITWKIFLQDGDQITLESSKPTHWKNGDLIILLVHGLAGSHLSNYNVRLGHLFFSQGAHVLRLNLRGSGTGSGLSRKLYHGGLSQDIHQALLSIKKIYPHSPIDLVGFSLGGNLCLKLFGELENEGCKLIRQLLAICPPIDLMSAAIRIGHKKNRIYEHHFLSRLKKMIQTLSFYFPNIPEIALPRNLSLFAFDELYTAKQWGFASAKNYYELNSSLPLISHIAVPCKLFFTSDDPFIDSSLIEDKRYPSHIEAIRTNFGGHMGCLQKFWNCFLDGLLEEWIFASGKEFNRLV